MDKNTVKKFKKVNQVCEMIDDIYYQYAASFGITDTELYILYALNEHNGEYLQSDICKEWSCSLQTIHTTIKNMEKKGVIELICRNGNKKNKYIHLTDFGKQLIDRITLPLVKAEQEAFEALTSEEQDLLIPILQKYADALSASVEKVMKQE